MAYKSVSALAETASSPLNVTVQSGVASGDKGIHIVLGATNAGGETPITVTPSEASLTFTRIAISTPDWPETDDNMWSDAWTVAGLAAADVGSTIANTLSSARNTCGQLIAFDSATTFGTPGTLGERSGTNDTIAAPSTSCSVGQLIYMIALDRSPAGTGYSSVVNSVGDTVTVHNYSEAGATGGNCSIMIASFIASTTSTGTTTVTYNNTSANAQALHIPGEMVSVNYTRSPSDTEGLSDSNSLEVGRAVTDSEGLTDTRVIDRDSVVPEALGTSDVVSTSLNHFKAASTLSEFNAATGTVTIPSVAVSGDSGILVVTGATNTTNEAVTVTPSRTGLTFTRPPTTPDFPESDDNEWTDVFLITGIDEGDASGSIDIDLGGLTRLTSAQVFLLDTTFDTPSALGERSGTNNAVTAPSMNCVPGQVILTLAVDRSPAGTGYTSLSNSNGRVVTVRSYSEATGTGGNCSIMLADFIETGTTTGATTVFYNHTSANAQALHIPLHVNVRDESQADTLGLSDTVVVNAGTSVTDSIGVTDSLVTSRALTISDAAGLSDVAAAPVIHDLSIEDTCYVADTDDEEELGVEETLTDSLGVTDAFTFDPVLGATDTQGLTDSTVIDRASVAADTLGLSDSSLVSLVYERSHTDTEGLSDSLSVQPGLSVTDSLGVTDSLTIDGTATVEDTAALSDSLNIEVTDGSIINLTATVVTADDLVIERDAVLAESTAITDALTVEILAVFEEVVGLSDALEIVATFERVLEEAADLTDEVALVGEFYVDLEDGAGLSDEARLFVGVPRDIAVKAILLGSGRAATVLRTTREAVVQP